MTKVIVVFGATGKQGGAVARSLLRDSSYKVRAVTRNVNCPRATALQQQGMELAQADYDDPPSLVRALNGAYGCFIVTDTDFTKPMEHEIKQGRNVADACVCANVQHVVFSTMYPVHKALGIPAINCDAKAEIEQYMRGLELPLSFITVPPYYENLLDKLRPQRDPNTGVFQIAIPIGHMAIDMMSVEDIGPVVHNIFANRSHFLNKTAKLSAEKMTVSDVAQVLRRQLDSHVFRDRQITVQEFRDLGFPGSVDLANMFDCFSRNEQQSSIDNTLKLNPDLQRFELWVSRHRNELLQCLQ